jgi:hypothetical protein
VLRRSALLLAALALPLGSSAEPAGTFWASVTGALETEGGGQALAHSSGGSFRLELTWPSADPAQANRLEIWRELTARPAPRAYPVLSSQGRRLKPEEFRVRYHRVEPLPVPGMALRLRTGTLWVDSSTSSRVAGRFRIEIAAQVPGELAERPLVIAGRFEAPLE